MEVRPGYKQTDIGVIPDDWAVRPLSEHFKIYAGGDAPKHSLSRTQSTAHPFPIFANALSNRGLYGYTAERRSTADSVTITARGYLGHAEYRSSPFFPIVRLLVLEPVGELDARFSAYAINEMVEFAVESTGVPQLTAPQVGKYRIGAPQTLEEQRKIAAALSDVDALLAGLDCLIAKKSALKQAAMQQLLTAQTRLPGFQGEWKLKPLSDLADVKTGPFGSSLHERDYVPDGTPIITVEHLGEFGVEHFNLPMVAELDRRRLQAYSLDPGDIVFSRVGSVDRNALIRSPEAGWLFSGRLLRVRPDRRQAYAPFLSYQFHSDPFKALVRSVAVGQTMASLNTQILKGINVRLPALDEQIEIAAVLSDMDAELMALEARRQKSRALKHAMVQELLTGKTRLV